MTQDLALRILGRLMRWDTTRARREFRWISLMSRLKYDGYRGFLPGARFLESLVYWLQQFKESERETAYMFVREKLIYFSTEEIEHLIELVYPETIQVRLMRATAERLGIPTYQVWSTAKAAELYQQLLRKSLFFGLSDGARMDALRRANVRILSNEQVVVSPEIDGTKWNSMLKELRSNLGDQSARFEFLFLLDDFVGSGTTLLRIDEGAWTGKLDKFWKRAKAYAPTHLADNFVVIVHHYLSTFKAKNEIVIREAAARKEKGADWFPVPVEFSESMTLPESFPLNAAAAGDFGKLIDGYYDPAIVTASMKKGGDDARYGFAKGGLPLVLEHNTPNNSVALIWAESNGTNGKPAMRPLFIRRERHS